MKRLVICCLLLFTHTIFSYAQDLQYTIEIHATFNRGTGSNSSACSNFCEVKAVLQNGSVVTLWNYNLANLPEKATWTTDRSNTFYYNNKIVKLQVTTRRTWSNMSGCNNGDAYKGYCEIPISFDGGCYEKNCPSNYKDPQGRDLYSGYSGIMDIKIHPSGINLQYFDIESKAAGYSDTLILPDKHKITIKPRQNYPINYTWEYQIGEEGYVTDKWVPYYVPFYTGYTPNPGWGDDPPPGHGEVIITEPDDGFECRPYNPENDNCAKCTDFPSGPCADMGGYWRYKKIFNGGAWKAIPAHYNRSELNICGNDLPGLPNGFLADVVKAKKQVRIRINYGCGTSEIRTLDGMKSSPTIIGHSVTDNLCAGDSTARIKLTFSEPLLTDESISISLNDNNFKETHANIRSFAAGNSYTITGLKKGTYNIRLLGKYPYVEPHPIDTTLFPIEEPDPWLPVNPSPPEPLYKIGGATYTGGRGHRDTIPVNDPPVLTFDATPTKIHCYGGNDGAITATIGGGKSPYTLTISHNGGADSVIFGITTSPYVIHNLSQGNYIVRLKDANSCIPRKTDDSEKIANLSITAQSTNPVQFGGITPVNPSGYGKTNGRMQLNPVTGGSGTYTYIWTKNSTPFMPSPSATDAQGLGAGTYRITVKDSQYDLASPATEANCRGCYDTITRTLTQPDSLMVQLSVKKIIKCNGDSNGELRAHIQGGVQPYASYYWEKWTGSVWQHQPGSDTTLNGLSSGQYRLTVTDAKANVTVSPEFAFIQPDSLKVAGFLQSMPSCYGDSDGWLEPVVTGGTAPYAYHWAGSFVNPDTIRITGLAKDIYSVTVTDANGCRTSEYHSLNQPDTLTITPVITLPSAYNAADGAIQLNVSGGTPAFNYAWAHNNATNNPLTGLAANGNPYPVTVTDSKGCSKNAYPRIIYPLGVEVQVRDSISCSGETNGKLAAWATGGVGQSYRYQWYHLVNNIPQTVGTNDSLLMNIGSGIYRVRVTDIEDNTALSTDFVFNAPDSLAVQLTARPLKCKFDTDGQIEAFPSGGTAPYTYLWSDGQTNKTAINLQEGSYSVTLTDRRGCFVVEQSAVTSPDELQATIHFIPPRAYNYSDASVWVRASGGTAPYSYAWQGRSEVLDSISGVPHGNYTAIITDTNGCSKQVSVTVPNPPLLEAFAAESKVISCNGRSDGQLTATSQGGVGSHRYTWYRMENSTSTQIGTGSTLNNIPIGAYKVKVTDANDIDAYSAVFTLTQPEILQVSASANAIACNGDTNGWVQATPTGGTAPYTYHWTSGHSTQRVEGLTDDKYLVLVNDVRGCEAKAQAEITVPAGLVVETNVIHPTCHNGNNGSISLNVSGGVTPYTYAWSNGLAEATLNSLQANTHTVTVTGANGCYKTISFTLENPEPIVISLGSDKTLCKGQKVELNATIADPAARYQWYKDNAPFAGTPVVSLSESGNYKVEATDAKGCMGEGSIRIQASNDDIVANFAVAAKVARGEVTKLVNTSYPTPERTEWLIPDDPNITVVSKTDEQAELIFKQNGTYTVGLRSGQGACEQSVYKPVTVVDKYDIPEYEAPKEAFLKQFIVFPNPSSGQFTVRVELGETADIQLRLVDIQGTLIDERKATGRDYYELSYNVGGRVGMHFLQLISKKANTSLKIILTP